jgi:Ca2+-binding RTX toxin-like protein
MDLLIGGNGNDVIRGGPGVDLCVDSQGSRDVANCEVVLPDRP